MTTFIWFILVIFALAALCCVVHLGRGMYPRHSTVAPWVDVLSLIINVVVVVWALWLLQAR